MIPIEREEPEVTRAFLWVLEGCIFCGKKTKFWYKEHEPVCIECAEKHDVNELLKISNERYKNGR